MIAPAESKSVVEWPASADAGPGLRVERSHLPALDGLRGIAVLLVLGFHFGIGAWFLGLKNPLVAATRYGWIGVDLFFVLSGFLITGILYDERRSPHYFRNFYARRTLRIFPLYYLGLLFAALLVMFWPPLAKIESKTFLWPSLYLSNIAIAADSWLAIPEHMSHYWSLSVEEHFYLFWPFVLRFGTRSQLMVMAASLATAALVLRIVLVVSGADPTLVFVLTPTRLDSLAIGGFLSLAVRGPGGVQALLRPAARVGGAAVVLVLLLNAVRRSINEYDPFVQTAGFTLWALAFGGLLISGIAWSPLKNLLENPGLRWLGRYSYGLYVWHYPIYFVFFEDDTLQRRFHVEGTFRSLLYVAASLAITLVIALVSYHLFEKQFLKLKSRFPREA